jgi:hypothetical protein
LRSPAFQSLTTIERVTDFWARLDVVTGLTTPFAPDRALVGWTWAGAVLVGVMLAVATWRTRRVAPGLLAVLVVGHSLLYSLNTLVDVVGPDARYLSLVMPLLAVVGGALVPDVRGVGARIAVVTAVAAATTALAAWGLIGLNQAAQDDTSLLLGSRDIDEVAALLDERHVGTAVTDSAGAQITFLTDGRVEASSLSVPRFASLEAAPAHDPTSTYVLNRLQFDNVPRLRAHLDQNQIPYEEEVMGSWHVFFLSAHLPPDDVPIITFADLAEPG